MVCHVWPGITPFNVMQMPLRQWLMFSRAADQWAKDREGVQGG